MNEKLEQLIVEYVKGQEKAQWIKVMEELEKSELIVPVTLQGDLSDEIKAKMKNGESFPITKEMNPVPMLLLNKEKGRVLPIFTSVGKTKGPVEFPNFIKMPFEAIIASAIYNQKNIQGIIINPFAEAFPMQNELIQFVDNHFKELKTSTKTVQITAEQFHKLAHMRVTYELLPKLFYTDVQSAFTQLREQHEQLILDMYGTIYPENLPCPYTEDDISIMSLNLREDLQVTRIDMPERNISPSVALRVYIAWKDETKLYFYTIEKGEKDEANKIGFITNDGKHTIMKEAPDNGSEFEAIMELVDAMQ